MTGVTDQLDRTDTGPSQYASSPEFIAGGSGGPAAELPSGPQEFLPSEGGGGGDGDMHTTVAGTPEWNPPEYTPPEPRTTPTTGWEPPERTTPPTGEGGDPEQPTPTDPEQPSGGGGGGGGGIDVGGGNVSTINVQTNKSPNTPEAAEWNVDADQTVAGQTEKLYNRDSAFFEVARQKMMRRMQAEGGQNTAMTAQMGELAAMEVAFKMGTADAATYARSAEFNATMKNQFGLAEQKFIHQATLDENSFRHAAALQTQRIEAQFESIRMDFAGRGALLNAQIAGDLQKIQTQLAGEFQQLQWKTASDFDIANLNAATSRYNTDVGAEVSMYNTDVSAATSRYATDSQANIQKYSTDVGAETSRENARLQAETSRYATDKNFEANKYSTDVSADVSRENAALAAETDRLGIETQAETSRYATDRQAESSRYGTDKQYDASIHSSEVSAYNARVAERTAMAEMANRREVEGMVARTNYFTNGINNVMNIANNPNLTPEQQTAAMQNGMAWLTSNASLIAGIWG